MSVPLATRGCSIAGALFSLSVMVACSDPDAGPLTAPVTSGPISPATSVLVELITLSFEDVSGAVTDQYGALGVTFEGAAIAQRDVNLHPAFPPRSGTKLIVDDSPAGGIVSVSFANAVSSAGGYVTGNRIITLRCY